MPKNEPIFSLDVDGNLVNVYFWDDSKILTKQANRFIKSRKKHSAAYVAYKTKKGWTHELHFVREWLGVGYVTHELVHLGVHLIGLLNPGEITEKREEQFANLVEEAARQFWDKHYELQDAT
jgi:hypothetical protein